MRSIAPGLLCLGLWIAAPGAADPVGGCLVDRADPRRPADARVWLDGQDARVAHALHEDHVAFLPTGRFADCPDFVPALVLFERPWQEVFRLLLATERHAEFLPKLTVLTAISRAPLPHVDRHELAILFQKIAFHVEQHWNVEERRIWWNLSPDFPNDIRAIAGFWELHPLDDGHTLGVYGTFIDVGPVLPRRMQSALTQRNLRTSIRSLRHWIDRGGGSEASVRGDEDGRRGR